MAPCNCRVSHVWGPPRDPGEAVRVLREAVEVGVDTSVRATSMVLMGPIKSSSRRSIFIRMGCSSSRKWGARRGADKSWMDALSRQELIDAVHDKPSKPGPGPARRVNLRVGEVV